MSDTNSPAEDQAPAQIIADKMSQRFARSGECLMLAGDIVAALAEAGYRIVGREPNEGMVAEGHRALVADLGIAPRPFTIERVWRTMWGAAE